MMNKRLSSIILAIFIAISSLAQEKDFELWTSISANKKLNKKWSVSLREDVRFYDNSSRLKTNYTQAALSYRIMKMLSVRAAYRFANRKQYDKTTEHQHLFLTDLRLRQNYRRFTLSYRLRYQKKYSAIYTREDGSIPSSYLRHKITAKYNIRKSRFSPYVAIELFQDMDYIDRYLQKKQRYTLACTYEFKNKNEATVFFTIQREVNQINPLQSGILGIKYNFNL